MAETHAPPSAERAGNWTGWSAAERESFFDAIARHRRAAWRVTIASLLANLTVALIVAVLMAPLFYGGLALLFDLVNLVIPAPNLVPPIGHALSVALNQPHTMSTGAWIRLGLLAALPGLVWMAFVLSALRRVLLLCMSFEAAELRARPPDGRILAEQRFGNVVAEMAIAASVPAPRVFIADSDVVDAVAFGVDEQHTSIVISQGLLARLDRAQMEGVAATLIASIADGDIGIGVRAALSISLFSLIARLGSLVTNKRNVRRNLAQVVRTMLLPTAASARKFVSELGSPLADDEGDRVPSEAAAANATTGAGGGAAASGTAASGTAGSGAAGAGGASGRAAGRGSPTLRERWDKLREYLWLPLAGPLVITGFFGALVNLFVLSPLLALTWRQRKYMADATAVRLTRDPDTLAGALEKISASRGTPLAPWAAHMAVADQGGGDKGMFGNSAVPLFPSIERRLRALGSMGAHVSRPPRRLPLVAVAILTPLLLLLAGLVALLFPLLIWLSLALTALFSGLPFAIVHALLRWLGHH